MYTRVRVRMPRRREKERNAKLIIKMNKTTQATSITNPEDGACALSPGIGGMRGGVGVIAPQTTCAHSHRTRPVA